jgi:hypothetical protein
VQHQYASPVRYAPTYNDRTHHQSTIAAVGSQRLRSQRVGAHVGTLVTAFYVQAGDGIARIDGIDGIAIGTVCSAFGQEIG